MKTPGYMQEEEPEQMVAVVVVERMQSYKNGSGMGGMEGLASV